VNNDGNPITFWEILAHSSHDKCIAKSEQADCREKASIQIMHLNVELLGYCYTHMSFRIVTQVTIKQFISTATEGEQNDETIRRGEQ
jgi:hypothetical protein